MGPRNAPPSSLRAAQSPRYTDDFWRLSPLGQCVVMQLSIQTPQTEDELIASTGYHRSLAPTLRALVRRGVVTHERWCEKTTRLLYGLTDAGLVMMGQPPHRASLTVIQGGAA